MRHVLIPFDLSAQAPVVDAQVQEAGGITMGTTWCVKWVAEYRADQVISRIQNELNTVIAQMSTWDEASHLSAYNGAAAGTWQALPSECWQVLRHALQIAAWSDGAYDPTMGPLVNVWGFGPNGPPRYPTALQLAEARARVGWQRLQLNPEQQSVLQPGGIYLDFSAIAKGFAVDQIARALQQQGIDSYLVEVGGELRGAGIKPDALPWWVALEQPPAIQSQVMLGDCVIALHGLSVATSGDYRRYVEVGGKRYSHTLDARSGNPVDHDLASVTVLHRECMAADAMSTALNVMGLHLGLAFANTHSIPARFIQRTEAGYAEHFSASFMELLQ